HFEPGPLAPGDPVIYPWVAGVKPSGKATIPSMQGERITSREARRAAKAAGMVGNCSPSSAFSSIRVVIGGRRGRIRRHYTHRVWKLTDWTQSGLNVFPALEPSIGTQSGNRRSRSCGRLRVVEQDFAGLSVHGMVGVGCLFKRKMVSDERGD